LPVGLSRAYTPVARLRAVAGLRRSLMGLVRRLEFAAWAVSGVLLTRSRFAVTCARPCGVPANRTCGACFQVPATSSFRLGPPFRALPNWHLPASRQQSPLVRTASADGSPAALLSFRPLQHIQGRRIRFKRAWQTRHLPSSGFGYPLDGLRPGDPSRPFSGRRRSWGCTLRSFPLPGGATAFPPH